MLNYEMKYKERTPVETIDIINNFFNSKGYKVEVMQQAKSEADTFWCHLNLVDIKTKNIIQNGNGKGVTEVYALASGYAEIYERFCSLTPIYTNPFLLKKYQDNNNNNNNNFLSYMDIDRNEDVNFKQFFNDLFNDDFSAEYYYNLINNNNPIGDIFYNLKTNEEKKFNIPLLRKIMGSTGLSAGNTLEESLVQGLSEYYERYAISQIVLNPNLKYFYINNNAIKNSTLEKIISKIEKNNNQVKIFDLSYNFCVPVVLVLIINFDTQNFIYSFGSFPVFDIALERTLTELYQGITNLNYSIPKNVPYKSFNQKEFPIINNLIKSIATRTGVPDNLFNNFIIDDINYDIFLNNKEYDNLFLLNYCKEINVKNNFNIYYKDISLSKDMFATQIYCSNINIYNNNSYLTKQNYSNKNKYIKTVGLIYEIINSLLQQKSNDLIYSHLITLLLNISINYSEADENIFKIFMQTDWLNIDLFISQKQYFSLNEIKNILSNNFENNYFHNSLLTIKQYLNNNYSLEEIDKIFSNFNINLNIIKLCANEEFLIWKIFFEDIFNLYNNQTIFNYINAIKGG